MYFSKRVYHTVFVIILYCMHLPFSSTWKAFRFSGVLTLSSSSFFSNYALNSYQCGLWKWEGCFRLYEKCNIVPFSTFLTSTLMLIIYLFPLLLLGSIFQILSFTSNAVQTLIYAGVWKVGDWHLKGEWVSCSWGGGSRWESNKRRSVGRREWWCTRLMSHGNFVACVA